MPLRAGADDGCGRRVSPQDARIRSVARLWKPASRSSSTGMAASRSALEDLAVNGVIEVSDRGESQGGLAWGRSRGVALRKSATRWAHGARRRLVLCEKICRNRASNEESRHFVCARPQGPSRRNVTSPRCEKLGQVFGTPVRPHQDAHVHALTSSSSVRPPSTTPQQAAILKRLSASSAGR